jgi:hypothetical protein
MSGTEWTNLKFSNDGKMILLSTNAGAIYLIDAFQGSQLHTFTVSNLSLNYGFYPICNNNFACRTCGEEGGHVASPTF